MSNFGELGGLTSSEFVVKVFSSRFGDNGGDNSPELLWRSLEFDRLLLDLRLNLRNLETFRFGSPNTKLTILLKISQSDLLNVSTYYKCQKLSHY